jgi:hypothetical protein
MKTSSYHFSTKTAQKAIRRGIDSADTRASGAALLLIASQNVLWALAHGFMTPASARRWERKINELFRELYPF